MKQPISICPRSNCGLIKEMGETSCGYCKSLPVCWLCDVIMDERGIIDSNKQSEILHGRCKGCEDVESRVKDYCTFCPGKRAIMPRIEEFKRRGNMCSYCITKINQKIRSEIESSNNQS